MANPLRPTFTQPSGNNVNPQTNAAATVQSGIVQQILFGFRSANLINVIPRNMDKVYFNRLASKGLLVDPVDTPSGSQDELTKDNIEVSVTEQMYYSEINPIREFQEDWAFLWSTGALTEAQVAPSIRKAISELSLQRIHNQIERNLWNGNDDQAPILDIDGQTINDRFNGVRKWLEDINIANQTPSNVNQYFDAPNAITGVALTSSNILDELDKVIDAIPDAVNAAGNIKILLSDHALKVYYQAQREATIQKGVNFMDGGVPAYGGYPLVTIGCRNTEMYAGHFGASSSDQIQAATWMTSDYNSVKMDKLQANSELWFYKALFKFGVGVLKPKEMVYYGPALPTS